LNLNCSGIPSTASYAEDDSITVNAPSSEYGPPKNGMCYATLDPKTFTFILVIYFNYEFRNLKIQLPIFSSSSLITKFNILCDLWVSKS